MTATTPATPTTTAATASSRHRTIAKATSTTTTVGDGPFTYDGTTHTGGSGTVTGAGGSPASATSLTYTGDQVNAGTYYVTAHYAGDANHEAQRRRHGRHRDRQGDVDDDDGGRRAVHLRRHDAHRRLGHGDRGGRPQHRLRRR